MNHCPGCGKLLTLAEAAAQICSSPACHLKSMAEKVRERERQQREALERQAHAVRDREAATLGVTEPERYPLTILPASTAPLTNISERRRRAFRDHLNRVLSQATVRENAIDKPEGRHPRKPLPLAVQTVMGGGCAACKGACCREGSDHAYLKEKTLRRVLKEQPGLRPRAVLAAYLDCLPRRSVQGSCIFHGVDGCTLPRTLRSDICNDYLCEAMEQFRLGKSGPEPIRVFFAATRNGTIQAAAFVDEQNCRPVAVVAVS